MGDAYLEPLIRDMTWSYSKLSTFLDCPYRWYLRYIRFPKAEDKALFFAEYGIFMHKLMELFLKREKSSKELELMYLRDFKENVTAPAPNLNIFESYFKDGLRSVKELKPLPFDIIAVEKKFKFKLGGFSFVGRIDVLAKKDGELFIIDNKSRKLRPRSKRAKPTLSDIELDNYLKQLYLYSAAIKEEYGKFPKALCFNCFREPRFIEEPFSMDTYFNTKKEFLDMIENIAKEEDFAPDGAFFKCRNLCSMQDHCEYFRLM